MLQAMLLLQLLSAAVESDCPTADEQLRNAQHNKTQ